MDLLKSKFPFLTESFCTNAGTPTQTLFLRGTFETLVPKARRDLDNKEIMVSLRANQYILTINNQYVTVAIGSIDPIVNTLEKIQKGQPTPPNALAVFLSNYN